MPKNVKGGTLWDFLNIRSVANYQKNDGGLFGAIEKIRESEKFEQSHSAKKRGKSFSVEKKLWNGSLSHVRGFRCVENEVLSTYGKSA